MIRRPPRSTRTDTLFPYTTLFRSGRAFYLAGGYKYAMAGEGACFLHAPAGWGLRPRDTGWYAAFGALERSGGGVVRSEEHTSELQSLMRISYAVFCLKKKKKHRYSREDKCNVTSATYRHIYT